MVPLMGEEEFARFRFQKGYCNERTAHSMSRAMAAELSPLGIRINVVAPGPITTPISERLQLPREQREPVKQKLNSTVPLGRFGQAEEVAKVVLLLAPDDSSYASEIVVDGGVTGALFGAPVYR
jgi:NAD(P)-dependent dehydrogenase (short-subunit alcohol dehydrogenase family)